MEKFDRIRVLAPLTLGVYIFLLFFARGEPGAGGLLLAITDIAAAIAATLIARRLIEAYSVTSWPQASRRLGVLMIVMVVLAILHLVAAFTADVQVQWILIYIPVALVFTVYVSYFFMKYKPKRRV